MKITNQSADELTLTEGNMIGMVVGVVLGIAGILAAVFLRAQAPIALWIGLALVVVGIVIVLFASSITVSANKKTGQLSYEKKRLVGAQASSYAIADIFRIETRKRWEVQNTGPSQNQGGSMPQPVLVAQSVIVFKDGRELALDHKKTSSTTQVGGMVMTGGQANETAMAAHVAKFLGVPFQEIMPPNMSSGVNIQF